MDVVNRDGCRQKACGLPHRSPSVAQPLERDLFYEAIYPWCDRLLSSSLLLAAEQSPACLAKRAEIERGISVAETHGNVREVRGLKKVFAGQQRPLHDGIA